MFFWVVVCITVACCLIVHDVIRRLVVDEAIVLCLAYYYLSLSPSTSFGRVSAWYLDVLHYGIYLVYVGSLYLFLSFDFWFSSFLYTLSRSFLRFIPFYEIRCPGDVSECLYL